MFGGWRTRLDEARGGNGVRRLQRYLLRATARLDCTVTIACLTAVMGR